MGHGIAPPPWDLLLPRIKDTSQRLPPYPLLIHSSNGYAQLMQQKKQGTAMFGSSDGWTGRLMQVLCTLRHEHHGAESQVVLKP
jgi:hypothetical protein